MASNWVVSTGVDDEDDEVYGPYTEAQARRVAAKLEAEIAIDNDGYGSVLHPRAITRANAWPLQRYDAFLTTEEKRELRRAARESKKEIDRRRED